MMVLSNQMRSIADEIDQAMDDKISCVNQELLDKGNNLMVTTLDQIYAPITNEINQALEDEFGAGHTIRLLLPIFREYRLAINAPDDNPDIKHAIEERVKAYFSKDDVALRMKRAYDQLKAQLEKLANQFEKEVQEIADAVKEQVLNHFKKKYAWSPEIMHFMQQLNYDLRPNKDAIFRLE